MTLPRARNHLPTIIKRAILGTVAVATVALGMGLSQSAAGASSAPAMANAPMAASATWQAPRLTKIVTEAKRQAALGNVMYATAGGHGARPAPLGSRVDCSGFIREMYGWAFGVDLGNGNGDSIVRTSGKFTKTDNPVLGDVALFGNGGRAPAYHAGIFIGSIGGHGAIVAASQTGTPVKIQQWFNRYWSGDLIGFWHFNGATAADSGPLTQAKMRGSLNAASGITYPQPATATKGPLAGIRVVGWAVDPQNIGASTKVSVTVDGVARATLPTNVSREDVNGHIPTVGNHGYSAGIPFDKPGAHTVCVVALPAGTNTAPVKIGCKTVTVPAPVKGKLDFANGERRAVTVIGWAFDPSAPKSSNVVSIIVDGKLLVRSPANAARADVNRAFHLTGQHGLRKRIALAPGKHKLCAIALPTSSKATQQLLGCKDVIVTS